MTRPRPKTDRKSARVSLYLSGSWRSALNDTLLPWFQTAGKEAWQKSLPTLVVVPLRSHAYAMKRLLLERGLSFLGVRCVAPAQLRELLGTRASMHLAL